MHRTTIALAGAIVMSAALLSAQGNTTATKYRGCLIPGSSEGSFVLSNAVAKTDKTKTKVSLKVVPENAKVNVGTHVTHEVEITGSVTAGTITATQISWKADYCG